MFTPIPRTDAVVARARTKSKGLTTAILAGSASLALGASVCSAVAAPAALGSQTAAFAVPRPTPTIPTLAEEARRKCEPHSFFRFHHFKPINFFIPRTRFIDGPGGTITASVRRQYRVYFEVEIEREKQSEINTGIDRDSLQRSILRRLRNNVNPLLAEEHIVEAGHLYAREVTPGKYGNLWYRVFGYRVGWSTWKQLSDCSVNHIATGIANVPARVEGWRYWETDHPMYRGRILSDK
ncbi:hypothetical protein ACFY19_14625 [Streptosporangium saharense]|uniref:Uncharacterized protein n=1 Tax=Streptosporangium saharense TaxID=1706840 RepID=A0A7W7VRT5_9ACTN|nr:hypothetical protein [Streptosporangium saharense]MBB4920476.1 hypothetical protein [Streptosporangium saharense]